MASVGSLTVEIAADIAKLRSGVEEAQGRITSLERSVNTNAKSMQASFESSIAGIKSAYIAGAAAITAALVTIQKGWKLAEVSAGYEEQKGMLDGLASKYGTTADSIIGSMKDASDGLIAKTDLMNVALGGLAKGLNPKQLTDLAAAADTLGDSVGKNATEALQDLAEAIEKGTEKQLKMYIGAQDLDAAMSQLSSKASEHEKAQARLNAVLEHAAKIQKTMGDESESTADKMDRFLSTVNDLKLAIGGGLVSAGMSVISVFQGISGGIFKVIEGYNKMMSINPANSKATKDYYQAAAQAAKETADQLFKDMRTNWDAAWSNATKPTVIPGMAGGDSSDNADSPVKKQKEISKELAVVWDERLQGMKDYHQVLYDLNVISDSQSEAIAAQEIARIQERQKAYEDEAAAFISLYLQKLDSITKLNEEINAQQAMIDQSVISRGLEGTNIGAPLMGLMESMNGEDPYQAQMDRLDELYAAQLDLYQNFCGDYIQIGNQFYTKQDAMAKLAQTRQLAIDKLTRQQKLTIAADTFGTLAAIAQAFYAASENQNKAALIAYKAFAIAETLVSTYSAAMKLFDFGSRFGPVVAAAMAAVAIAAGMARIAQISSIHANTSTVSAGAGSGISVGEGTAPSVTETTTDTTTAAATSQEAQARSQTINIYVQGNLVDYDKFAREVIPSILKAQSDGVA